MFYYKLYVLAVLSEILYTISFRYYIESRGDYKTDLYIIMRLSIFIVFLPVAIVGYHLEEGALTKQRRFWWKK